MHLTLLQAGAHVSYDPCLLQTHFTPETPNGFVNKSENWSCDLMCTAWVTFSKNYLEQNNCQPQCALSSHKTLDYQWCRWQLWLSHLKIIWFRWWKSSYCNKYWDNTNSRIAFIIALYLVSTVHCAITFFLDIKLLSLNSQHPLIGLLLPSLYDLWYATSMILMSTFRISQDPND